MDESQMRDGQAMVELKKMGAAAGTWLAKINLTVLEDFKAEEKDQMSVNKREQLVALEDRITTGLAKVATGAVSGEWR